MASSFPHGIATRATTQRNNADSVGNTIDNPVEIIECPSDLDSIGSDSPYYRTGTSMAAIKLDGQGPQWSLHKGTSKAKSLST